MSYSVRGMGAWDGERTIAFAGPWLENARGRDLFLWLHFFDVHSPYDSPEDYYRPYYFADKDPYDKNLPKLSENQTVPWDEQARDLAYIESRYRGEVTYLDELVGKFLEIDRIQSGVIGFTADHGEWLRGPEYFFIHATLSPSTLNVPLIIAWPDAPAGKRVKHPVQNIDLGRTLLDLAGEATATFPGATLFPQEAPEEGTPRFTIETGGRAASIRSGRWFLVLNLAWIKATDRSAERQRHAYRLHDLSTDPICQVDLSTQHKVRAKKLRATLINWLQSGSKGRWAVDRDVSQTELDQLAQLGYSDALTGSSQSDWYEGECACQWCVTAE
ncbi:MAG: arylsulfatase [Planctomycetota bacterium]|jgi:arylsulfatase